jgi:hypothetical protein
MANPFDFHEEPDFAPPIRRPDKGEAGLSALLIGGGGLLLFWFPVVGAVMGLVAVIMAFVSFGKGEPRASITMAVAGGVLGVVAILASILAVIVGLAILMHDANL